MGSCEYVSTHTFVVLYTRDYAHTERKHEELPLTGRVSRDRFVFD